MKKTEKFAKWDSSQRILKVVPGQSSSFAAVAEKKARRRCLLRRRCGAMAGRRCERRRVTAGRGAGQQRRSLCSLEELRFFREKKLNGIRFILDNKLKKLRLFLNKRDGFWFLDFFLEPPSNSDKGRRRRMWKKKEKGNETEEEKVRWKEIAKKKNRKGESRKSWLIND